MSLAHTAVLTTGLRKGYRNLLLQTRSSVLAAKRALSIFRFYNPPPFLQNILEGDDKQSIEFQDNIRQYNMALAFTSLGVKEDRLVNRRGGWVFRISGELCHLIGSLRPHEDRPPKYAQLYIYDS